MRKHVGYKFQLITAWGAVGLVVLGYLTEYFAGMANNLIASCLHIILLPSQVLLLLTSGVAFLIICSGRRLGKKQLVISLFSLSVALIVCLLNFPLMKLRPAGAQVFLKGFEKWVNNNVDTNSIQLWIQSTDEKYWESGRVLDMAYYKGIQEELPDFMKEFGPKYIHFELSELDNSKTVHFRWGGGMFSWNLVIGEPNMKMPAQEVEWFSDYDVEFRRFLKPGVYVFSRG